MAANLTAGDIMTDGVIAIEQTVSVKDAAAKMREEGIRSLVVLDEGEAVGIVVGRDMVYDIISEGRDVHKTPVSAVMTDDLVTAAETDVVEDLARAMLEHNISRVPILRGDQLVGIVTQSNIMEAWPSYIDLLREENQAFAGDAGHEQQTAMSGECSQCDNYSEELINVDGTFLCPECRAEL